MSLSKFLLSSIFLIFSIIAVSSANAAPEHKPQFDRADYNLDKNLLNQIVYSGDDTTDYTNDYNYWVGQVVSIHGDRIGILAIEQNGLILNTNFVETVDRKTLSILVPCDGAFCAGDTVYSTRTHDRLGTIQRIFMPIGYRAAWVAQVYSKEGTPQNAYKGDIAYVQNRHLHNYPGYITKETKCASNWYLKVDVCAGDKVSYYDKYNYLSDVARIGFVSVKGIVQRTFGDGTVDVRMTEYKSDNDVHEELKEKEFWNVVSLNKE